VKTILLFLIPFALPLSAQTVITVQGGSNFRTEPLSLEQNTSLIDPWKSSTTAIAAVDIILKRTFALSAGLEYDNYPFGSYPAHDITIPEYKLISSSGDATKIYRASIEGKLRLPPIGHFSLYFDSGVSYITEDIGKLNYTYSELDGPDHEIIHSSQLNNYWAHTLGVGFQYSFSEHYGIVLTTKYFSNYSTHFQTLVAFGLFYIL
jgi:hypothetical protein